MKIIDLLNKIANGEEVPKRIKYDNKTYFYDREAQDYSDYDKYYGLFSDYDKYYGLFSDYDKYYGLFSDFLDNQYGLNNCLNEEVEIIEEEKKIPEKLDLGNATVNEQQIDYKSRNEKAIEYVERVCESEKNINPYILHAPTLLNILQGSDKE